MLKFWPFRIGIVMLGIKRFNFVAKFIGSFIANLEGYSDRETLLIVLPSMWMGIISWTLWFDELYKFIDRIGRGKTMFITIFLLAAPVIFYLINLMSRGKKANNLRRTS